MPTLKNARKFLFLDVDGVLNNYQLQEQFGAKVLGEEHLQRLKRLVDNTDCFVVITSAWKLYSDYVDILVPALHGIGIQEYIHTPDESYKTCICDEQVRQSEIDTFLRWRSDNVKDVPEVKSLILDDMDLNQPNFIRCNPFIGLTDEIVDECIKLFNGDCNE